MSLSTDPAGATPVRRAAPTRFRVLRALGGAGLAIQTAAALLALTVLAAILAPVIAPSDPYDLAAIDLFDALKPPAWLPDGDLRMPLGSDDQGRDMASVMLYGTRMSLFIATVATLLSVVLGVGIGLAAGYAGGWLDTVLMRLADAQMAFPAILLALLIDGLAIAAWGPGQHAEISILVLIFAIGLSHWVPFARTVRGSMLVEKEKDYVLAARISGVPTRRILLRHILPNVIGPVVVIGTLTLALSIITEATLSFLGVGLPPTEPSLGTMVRTGSGYLYSGEWWMATLPAIALAVIILSANLFGDWLRDVLNPKLS